MIKGRMNLMDSKKVNALITAVDKGSLTAAAAELGYTQSGMTHMMNSLEDELGVRLLIRRKNGVRLSPDGELLLPRLRALTEAAEELEREVQRLRDRSASTIRLGAYSSVARHWVPDILSAFWQISPGTQISITADSIVGLYSAVQNGELDCAIVSRQEAMLHGMEWVPLWEDELLAVLPANDPAVGESYPVQSFQDAVFLMPSQGFDLDIAPIFRTADGRSITPNLRYTNMDDASIVSMVEHGLGVTVLTRLVMQGMQYRVRTVPLAPRAARSLGIIVGERTASDRGVRRLITCAVNVIAAMHGQSPATAQARENSSSTNP